jgi:hypothetical protein
MFGGGFIQSMTNTEKRNRAILPSQRTKFMEDKKIKYSRGKKDKALKFKKISENELEEAVYKIKIDAQKEKRKLRILILFLVTITAILILIFAFYVLLNWDWSSSNFFRIR